MIKSIEEISQLVTYSINAEYSDDDNSELIESGITFDCDNMWNWCNVEVTAEFNGLKHSDHLGACCYDSEEQFKKCAYYEDMKANAFIGLYKDIKELYKNLSK